LRRWGKEGEECGGEKREEIEE